MSSSNISEIKKIFAENITSGTSIFFSSGLLILFLDNNELFGAFLTNGVAFPNPLNSLLGHNV